MKEVIRIFKEIQETSSKNDKMRIIKDNSNNELFKANLKFLLDPNIVTGISKKKLENMSSGRNGMCAMVGNKPVISEWAVCLKYLEEHNKGSYTTIIFMQDFLRFQPKEDRWFYVGMISKTLKLGCDAKTVNKAIPGLIPIWEVQLGSGYDKLKLKDGEWFSLSRKLNGVRASYYDGKLISRQGKELKGFDHIIKELKDLGYDERWFVDGELIRKNVDGISDNENFRIGTGIINSDAETKEEIEYVIFDAINEKLPDWFSKPLTYRGRKAHLNFMRKVIETHEIKNIRIVEMVYEGTDQSQIEKWLQYAVDNDWEGLMLNKDAPYERKRTTNLIKIKRFYTMDLKVVSVEEGDGRLQGTLGALFVSYKGNLVGVGSGFTDEQRRTIWANKDAVLGKIVEVKYKEISKDKDTGLESLQFPVFVRFRDDKSETSYD